MSSNESYMAVVMQYTKYMFNINKKMFIYNRSDSFFLFQLQIKI